MGDWFSSNGITDYAMVGSGQTGLSDASLSGGQVGTQPVGPQTMMDANGNPISGTDSVGAYQPPSGTPPSSTMSSMANPSGLPTTTQGYSLDPGTGQGALLQGFDSAFQGPTNVAATPGYQFSLQQGENSIQNTAAAKGNLLSGQTLADMSGFASGLASQTYQQQYNNAQQEYANAFNIYNTNSNNNYNRLSGMASLGQNAASTTGNQGVATGANVANTTTGIGNATAAGTVGSANAVNGTLGNLSNMGSTLALANAYQTPKNVQPTSDGSMYYGG